MLSEGDIVPDELPTCFDCFLSSSTDQKHHYFERYSLC